MHLPGRCGPTRVLTCACALLLAACSVQTPAATSSTDGLPVVAANDNRAPAGRLENGDLELRMVVRTARWYPEAERGRYVDVPAFAEEGRPAQIPAPLIRVPAGTTIAVTIRNDLPDSTLWVRGLATRPAADDSIAIDPGERRTLRFDAGAPGTYLYSATAGVVDREVREREQLAGAFIVDEPGAPANDRVFVINIWGEPPDSLHYRNAVAINGKSWPYTERIDAAVGDTLRWRIVNASVRNHPMHLHGFYYRVDARGGPLADTVYAAGQKRLVVTEDLSAGSTMAMVWSPEREGNWLFHCHLTFHVMPEARLDPPASSAHDVHDADPGRHMAGLVLGITARPRAGAALARRGPARALRLFVNEGRPRHRAPRAFGYVLERDGATPAPDSVELPGSPLILTRGEPTDITVVNRLREGTAVHWHGIELESWSDGVAGWSGLGHRVAPVIAPGDSFTARLTLPRAGTFMYHTHLNDIEQVTSGLYGAIVVLEPGQRFDPRTDHVFVAGWDGPEPPHILVNGDSLPAPMEMAYGETHRLRFVNIGPAARLLFSMRRDTTLATWRARAKDGADLPPHARTPRPAIQRIAVGETWDFEFEPPARGEYSLSVGPPDAPPAYVRRVIVR